MWQPGVGQRGRAKIPRQWARVPKQQLLKARPRALIMVCACRLATIPYDLIARLILGSNMSQEQVTALGFLKTPRLLRLGRCGAPRRLLALLTVGRAELPAVAFAPPTARTAPDQHSVRRREQSLGASAGGGDSAPAARSVCACAQDLPPAGPAARRQPRARGGGGAGHDAHQPLAGLHLVSGRTRNATRASPQPAIPLAGRTAVQLS